MLYKPNYCNHCGEKVERFEWKPWTSRRFCENCESSFQGVDWMPKIFGGVIILFGFFGIGSYLKTPEKPLAAVSNQLSVGLAEKPKPAAKDSGLSAEKPLPASKENPDKESEAGNRAKSTTNAQSVSPQQRSEPEQIQPKEPVFYCGAQTKKGSACTRKVKGGKRCWQHEGLPAMLPPEKLKVVE